MSDTHVSEQVKPTPTPGPWRTGNGIGSASVKGPDCAVYINVRKLGETDECVARWQADADLIVRAVNSHDAYDSETRDFVTWIRENPGMRPDYEELAEWAERFAAIHVAAGR